MQLPLSVGKALSECKLETQWGQGNMWCCFFSEFWDYRRQIAGITVPGLHGLLGSRGSAVGEGAASRVSPPECTPAPRPFCEPLSGPLRPAPSLLRAVAFPAGLQSWLSFWRVSQSKSCGIPDPGSIPEIFQVERGQRLIHVLPSDNIASHGKADGTQLIWVTLFHRCWPPPYPSGGRGSSLLTGLSCSPTMSIYTRLCPTQSPSDVTSLCSPNPSSLQSGLPYCPDPPLTNSTIQTGLPCPSHTLAPIPHLGLCLYSLLTWHTHNFLPLWLGVSGVMYSKFPSDYTYIQRNCRPCTTLQMCFELFLFLRSRAQRQEIGFIPLPVPSTTGRTEGPRIYIQ